MKRNIIYIVIALIFFSSIISISALNTGEIKTCKADCNSNKLTIVENCSNIYLLCKNNCNKNRGCMNNCSNIQKVCIASVNTYFSKCSKKCAYVGKNITCNNGKYNAGDVFLDKCQICECGYNSKVSCKKTDFCNFNDILNDRNTCQSSNGLFQQLCNGPYFDIVCSKDSFCLCNGVNDYNCPNNYYCLHNFSLSLTRRGYTIAGWKTLLGVHLGDIGICVKKPQLESCGNGICDNLILPGKEAETSLNCPEDCK